MNIDNKQRAAWAEAALDFYAKLPGTGLEMEDDMTRLNDLLANLMHFCAQHKDREDCPMNFEQALSTAEIHYQTEK